MTNCEIPENLSVRLIDKNNKDIISPFRSKIKRDSSINNQNDNNLENDSNKINKSIDEDNEIEKNKSIPIRETMDKQKNKVKKAAHQLHRDHSKSIVSFTNGIPQNLDDIERLESPLYKVSTQSIVNKNIKKANLDKQNMIQNTLEKSFNSNVHTILQIINCIIRYTIVQFPFCIKILGIIYGSAIISIIAVMSMYSIYLIVMIYNVKHLNSFSLYAYEWWGMKGKIMILFLNLFGAFGSCLSYIIITLKIVPKLCETFFGVDTIFSNKLFWSILAGFILVIYSLKKDISGTKSAAVVGIVAIFTFLSLIVFDLLYSSSTEQMSDEFKLNFNHFKLEYDFFSCIACVILSFAFHPYTFSIYECLEEKTTRNMMVTSCIGIFSSLFIYLLIGSIGYIMYGEKISESFLDSMDIKSGSPLLILENIAYVLNVIMSFPITFAVLKNYIFYAVSLLLTHIRDMGKKVKKMIKKVSKNKCEIFESNMDNIEEIKEKEEHEKEIDEEKDLNEGSDTENKEDEADGNKQETDVQHDDHFDASIAIVRHGSHHHHGMVVLPPWAQSILSIIVVSLIIYIAIEYSSIKVIFSFLGATYANINAFILPSLFYLKFASDGSLKKNLLPYIFIGIGLIGLVTCVVSNILSIAHGNPH